MRSRALSSMSISFFVHLYFDKHYHVAGSWLGRFAWFRRKQDVPGRPYAVAMETVRLAPNAQVSLYP